MHALIDQPPVFPSHIEFFRPSEKETDKISLLFCLYSKAEAVDICDTFKQLDKERVVIHVLAFGTAKTHLQDKYPDLLLSIPGIEEIGHQGCYQEKELNEKVIEKIIKVVQESQIFVTGLGSNIQVDILQKLHAKQLTYCVGYYDPFQSMKEHAFAKRLLQRRDGYLHSLRVTCESLKKECQETLPDLAVEVVGKRDLDVWKKASKEKNVEVLKKAEVVWNPTHTTILYAGCYGNDYPQDFRLFLESIEACQASSPQPIDVWVSLHPAQECTGEVELREINKLGLKNIILVKKGIPTVELLPFADLLVSATSGVVLNAVAYGKPSFYVCHTYTNYLIDQKILERVTNKEHFSDLFKQVDTLPVVPSSLKEEIPENASQHITDYLNGIIQVVHHQANLKAS